jgi:fibronectin type 3 domain-containing protein
VKNWPFEDVIVALKPKTPALPFGLPSSKRLLDPTLPAGASTPTFNRPGADMVSAFVQLNLDVNSPNYGQPLATTNVNQNFDWEYVWHCHILGHEENDLMRPLVFKPVVTAPAAPTNVSVTPSGKVTWTDATPTNDLVANRGATGNEFGFSVQRVALANGLPVTTTYTAATAPVPTVDPRVNTLANATQFQETLTSLQPNTDYQYQVVAVNEAGATPSVSTGVLMQAPAAPTLFSVVQGTGLPNNTFPVTLTWKDVATNEDGYALSGAALAALPANTGSYTANLGPAVAGTVFTFNVAATKAGFDNSAAAPTSLTVVPTLTAPTGLTAVTNATTKTAVLTWVDQAFAETGYQVTRAPVTINNLTGLPGPGVAAAAVRPTLTTVLPTNANTVTDTALAANTLYQYKVFAMNGAVASTTPASLYATTALNLGAAPSQLQTTGAPTTTSVGIQWQNTASTLATGYEVQQCTGTALACTATTALWTPVPGNMTKGANGTQFIATGLTTKTTYSFRVRAINTLVPKATNGDPGLVSPWSKPFATKTL